ncbi:holin [Endozoicomonas sp. SM1973]|uniref:Holin n=1 Tax=Spartinivicinus marinus TaxID=2994442 RepID=A0A853I9L6_9GAMM|nr:phage holin [Spartinivicinus marinus]MCX4025183.1 phage holin [Spartinivicinus marinus]NYZ69983.1 holin [Spartinivicinus marinus]
MVTEKIISNAPYVASAGTVIAGLTLKDWGVIIGIILTTITVVVNWVYKHRRDKRETELFNRQITNLSQSANK